MLKLFGHDPSPYVRRIRVLLAELGLPFERDARGWLDPSPEFLRNAPTKRLPMLDRGPDFPVRYVFESRVIAALLYEMPEKKPAADLQRTLYAPALGELDQNLVSALDAGLDAAINVYLLEKDGIARTAVPYLARQADRVNECLDWANAQYAGKSTLVPGELAYVDLCVGSTIGWMRFRKVCDVGRWPNLVAVETALGKRASFLKSQPE